MTSNFTYDFLCFHQKCMSMHSVVMFPWGLCSLYFVWFSFSCQTLFQGPLCQQVWVWVVSTPTQQWETFSSVNSSMRPQAWALPELPKCKLGPSGILIIPWSPQCVLLTHNGSTTSGTLPSHTKACAHLREGHQTLLTLHKTHTHTHTPIMRFHLFCLPFQGMASPTMDSLHTVELPSILEPLNLMLGWNMVSNTVVFPIVKKEWKIKSFILLLITLSSWKNLINAGKLRRYFCIKKCYFLWQI